MQWESTKLDKAKLALLAMQRHSWEQGVAMQAFLEQGDMGVVTAMAKEAAYRSMPDGRTASIGVFDAVTDPCSVGEALIVAAEKTSDASLKAGLEKLLHWALELAPRNAQGVCYHLMDKPQFWVDSIYMLPPFLAAAGHKDEAMLQFNGYYHALHDPDSGLMAHMWDDDAQTFIRAAHWGVGNGWALAGMARLITLIPEKREELAEKAQALLDSLMPYLRPDGLFHDVVDDPSTFVETNLPQMAAYTIYRGIREGWLALPYAGYADKMRNAALAKVDRYGLVQNVCGAPTFNKPGVAPEGQAFFLLMDVAYSAYQTGVKGE